MHDRDTHARAPAIAASAILADDDQAPTPVTDLRCSYRAGDRATVLATCTHPAVDLAIWRRRLPSGLTDALAVWARTAARFDGEIDAHHLDLEPLLGGLGPAPWRRWLRADLEALLDHFVTITDRPRLRLGFGRLPAGRGGRFQVDQVRFRLVTSYLGEGAAWIPNEAIVRDTVDLRAATDATGGYQIRRPGAIRQASPGDVVLLKGARPGDAARGVVHRAPAEAGGVEPIVLTLATLD